MILDEKQIMQLAKKSGFTTFTEIYPCSKGCPITNELTYFSKLVINEIIEEIKKINEDFEYEFGAKVSINKLISILEAKSNV